MPIAWSSPHPGLRQSTASRPAGMDRLAAPLDPPGALLFDPNVTAGKRGAMEEGLGQAWAQVAVPFRRADASVDALRASARPRAHGKFLFLGDEKLCLRGATYGTFAPDVHGDEFPEHGIVERDFAQMAANGLNAVRVFTAPPRLLLDAAREHGLHVLVGLSAERYVGFLADKNGAPDIEGLVRTQVRACAAHPAVLGYALGNEIPASLVRWLG